MLLKEFLEDTIDNITEQDFINLKNQINDLTKFKKASQEKIKTDVNYNDIDELQALFNQLGIDYINKEEIKSRISKLENKKKKLNNDQINDIEKLDRQIKNNELAKKEAENIWEKTPGNVTNYYGKLYYKISDQIRNFFYKKPIFDREWALIWYFLENLWQIEEQDNKYDLSRIYNININYILHELEKGRNHASDSEYCIIDRIIQEALDSVVEDSNKFLNRIDKIKNYLLYVSQNFKYDNKKYGYINYWVKDTLKKIDLIANSVLAKAKEYEKELKNAKIKDEESELAKERILKPFRDKTAEIIKDINNIRNKYYSQLQTIQKEIDLYHYKDMEVNEMNDTQYYKYLLKILNTYIKELMDKLQIVQGRFGIGKGTGSALTRFRNYEENVNNILSASEKAMLIGWLCKHIRRMMVHVMEGGASEKVFNLLFPNVHNYDTSLKSSDNAWDARSGEIVIDSEENITPQIQKLFNKVTANKAQVSINNTEQESGKFKGNKLNSAPFVYLLLNEYYNFGFTLGNINISPEQAYELQRNKFSQNEQSFDKGYNS